MSEFYRVQDREGRGPYKPGMSRRWADREGAILPTIMDEFPDVLSLFRDRGQQGCAFRDLASANKWFSPSERRRMKLLGYRLVKIIDADILAESENQVVIWRNESFKKAAPVYWGDEQGS